MAPSSAPDGGGNYKGMLEQMRSELGWRDRAAGERQQVNRDTSDITSRRQCYLGRVFVRRWGEPIWRQYVVAEPNPDGKGRDQGHVQTGHERPWKGRVFLIHDEGY